MDDYWYNHRHELQPDMVFKCHDGSIVRLDSRLAGDGTKWKVHDWSNYCQDFLYEDSTIEPGELKDRLVDRE